jgi:hypothetical protein
MPKHNLGELSKKIDSLQTQLENTASTATASLVIAGISLTIILLHIALS